MSDIHFINADKSDFQNEYFKVMDKTFEKARAKSLAKGGEELTLEAFLDKNERDCDRAEKMKFIYFLFPFIVTPLSYLYTSLINGFGRISNPVIYVCVILITSGLVALLLYKNFRKSLALRRAWINTRREEIKTQTQRGNYEE